MLKVRFADGTKPAGDGMIKAPRRIIMEPSRMVRCDTTLADILSNPEYTPLNI